MAGTRRSGVGRIGTVAILLAPSILFAAFALKSGGFFPDAFAAAAVLGLLAFAIRTVVTPAPFSGVTPALAVVAIALMILAAWILASGSWSRAPASATIEYTRALLYAVVFVLTGAVGRSAQRARLLLLSLTVASVAVSIAASATWLLPHAFPTSNAAGHYRLAWPTSYWNATGLIAALALVWSTSITCSATEPPLSRVLAAAGAPICAAALIFTVSRGATAVTILGLIVAVATIRSSATPGGLLTLAPGIAMAVILALRVSGLNVNEPTRQAITSGHHTAILLVVASALSAALRGLGLMLDARLARMRAPRSTPRIRTALAGVVAVGVLAFLALGGIHAVKAGVHKFVSPETQSVALGLPASQRLLQLGGNNRIDNWRVAFVDGFRRHPILGTGAGTYATLWTRYAPPNSKRVQNAHSLYLEELAEVGIVGGVLVLVVVLAVIVALARRATGPERMAWGALLAGAVMWAVHAGFDWDWQMPAATTWYFAAGGLALSAPRDRPAAETSLRLRLVTACGCLILAVTPALIWRSQTQLIEAVTAFERGDCLSAERHALASNAALGSRADPFEVISYCEAGARRFALALSAIQAAEIRAPQNWELRYSDALISALAGLDPRPAAAAALARYPTSPLVQAEFRAFDEGSPRHWRRFALSAPLPL